MTRPLMELGAPRPALLGSSLNELLSRWLPRQRWYASSGRRITEISVVAATALTPECFHLLVRVQEAGQQEETHYQLILGAAVDPPPRLWQHALGQMDGPAGGTLMVYDALHDHRVAVLLLDRLREGGKAGVLRFESFRHASLPTGLAPRVLDTEQSNSSIVYGDRLILKLFRRIQQGINPDLEVTARLGRWGHPSVPAPEAWFFVTEPFWGTLGMVQPFLPGATDGWQLALDSAAAQSDFVKQARGLGRTTGELHAALAHVFPTAKPEEQHRSRLAEEMMHRLKHSAEAVPALRRHVPAVQRIFADAAATRSEPPLQRIHGDLHLGQVLWADGSWHAVDFEGEPSRPLAERRADRSPIRDVVGMLRSFDYAAHMSPTPCPQWAEQCRTAFCSGYSEAGGFEPTEAPELLRAYEADRAVYEVLYEATHRPDWITVPLEAVARLADTH
ncbi:MULTISPECIES: maltokinase N-terminal cap-like domain-containing protein [unclassified Streptomyces]|uniref:maltokinase N-terminal cap-like domain-containing protein n=1 Tax=unclassified Streptomyces TaxID=2593676 RepID=UPI003BB49773